MKYPVKPKEGSPILTIDNSAIPLHGIRDIFSTSNHDEQVKLCNKLGISFHDGGIFISFQERGKAYKTPNEDRNLLDDIESEYQFNLTFRPMETVDSFPLKLSINLEECTFQPFVNFLGEIRFTNAKGLEVFVPLIGRGTAALEGRANDAHCGFCTSDYGASFQERVAILSSLLAGVEISRDDIEIFRAHLLKACNRYIGSEELLSYTIDKAFSLTTESFFEYMKGIYMDKDESEIPLMLSHFEEFAEPHPMYFYELPIHLSQEEIDNELKYISSNSYGPDQKQISSRVREIINKFIFYDGVYLIRPNAGNLCISTKEKDITIYDIACEFNAGNLQNCLSLLEGMGVFIHNDKVQLSFAESGSKLIRDKDDLDVKNNGSDDSFQLTLSRKSQSLDSILKMKFFLDIEPMDNVNFFGRIEVRYSLFRKIIIPLVGRGTIVLEGSLGNRHKGFCTNNESASFLQRVAIIYCSLILLDVDTNDLHVFEKYIMSLNYQYYGRHAIVDYIFKVAKDETRETYYEYMQRNNMNYSEMPIIIKTLLTYNRLPPKYFEDVSSKYTEEELIVEEELFDKGRILNFVPRLFHQALSFIRNIDIF